MGAVRARATSRFPWRSGLCRNWATVAGTPWKSSISSRTERPSLGWPANIFTVSRKEHKMNRREFLESVAIVSTAQTRLWAANDKVNVAIIGVGGRGSDHVSDYCRRNDLNLV